jgi:hypothetical protein
LNQNNYLVTPPFFVFLKSLGIEFANCRLTDKQLPGKNTNKSSYSRKCSPTMINKLSCALLLLLTFFAAHIIFPARMIYAASLHLAWNGNTEDDLAGYKVYYGTSPGIYGVPHVLGDVTEYELSGLEEEIRYYIALSAFDYSNNESEKSAEMSGVPYPSPDTSNTSSSPTSTTTTVNPATPVTSTTTPATTTSSIQPDITPPRGTITINNDETVTDSPNVVLSLLASDNDSDLPGNTPTAQSGQEATVALVMSFSNDNQNWSDPEPYTTTKIWTLSPGDGEKTVYVNFRDAAGNWMAEPAQDQILYQESDYACDTSHKLQPASIKASSEFLPFFSKNNAIDGNPLTSWSTILSFFKKDEFITLDLGDIQRVSSLTMKAASTLFGTDLFPVNFKLEISRDNMTWEEISTEQGYSPPIQSTHSDSWDFKSIECRYIRVHITKAKTIFFFFKMARIAEIELYGCDIAGSPSLTTSEDLASVNLKDYDQLPLSVPGKPKNSSAGSTDDVSAAYGNEVYQESSVICDDGDMCTSFTGIWDPSENSDVYGNTSLISRQGGAYTWTPDLPRTGSYGLYMWWSSDIANCSSCPVDITCNGELRDTLYLNQRQDGGQWNPLGTYNLESGNTCSVTLTSESSSLKTCADAVRFVYRGERLPECGINSIYPNPAAVEEEVCFEGYGIPGDGMSIEDYIWRSNLDGMLSTSNSFCTSSLSEGTHRITFKVRTDGEIWSAPAENMVSITNNLPFPQETWLEAEEGIINSPMEVDWDKDASTGEYIWIPNTLGNVLDSTQDSGYAEYSFEVLEAGDFVAWGRVIANSAQDDSFFVSMDGGTFTLWDTFKGGEENWVWDQVSDRRTAEPVIFHLDAGIHTLVIKQREDGTKLDKILITNDRAYDPSGLDE